MVNSIHTYSQVLTNIFNDCVKNCNFPDILKYADITNKTNYRPISTPSNFSKVFEKLIYAQIDSFMNPNYPNTQQVSVQNVMPSMLFQK